MSRVTPQQASFASGEISPLLYGRADFLRYQNGLAQCRGFMPLPEGGATRGPGTEFIAFTRGSLPGRLLPFTFSTGDARMVELTDGRARILTSAGPIMAGAVPYEIASPYPAASIDLIQTRQSADRIFMVDGERAPRRLSRFADTNWQFDLAPFEAGPLRPQNIDEGHTIQASAETGTVTLTANAATFQAGHVGAFFRLLALDESDAPYWSGNASISTGGRMRVDSIVYQVVGFDGNAGTTGTVAPSHTSGTQAAYDGGPQWEFIGAGNLGPSEPLVLSQPANLGQRFFVAGPNATYELASFPTASGSTGVNQPVHTEGRWLASKGGPIWDVVNDGTGIVQITSVTSATVAIGTVRRRLPTSVVQSPTYRWAEGAWSDVRGWPAAITSDDQRMIFASTPSDPRSVWFSATGSNLDMEPGIEADDAFGYTIAPLRDRLDRIVWIERSTRGIIVGTAGEEVLLRSTDEQVGLTPTTTKFEPATSRGSAPQQPVVIDGVPTFLDRSRRSVVNIQYDFAADRTAADDLARVARHILGRGIRAMAWQQTPYRVLWCALVTGELVGLNYYPDDQQIGWHRHPLAGGAAEHVAVLPNAAGTEDQVWLIVRRQIGGVTRRCVEIIAPLYVDNLDAPASDAWHQFCAIRYQGAAVAEIGGLGHLAGQTVTAWTDHGAYTGLVVSPGGSVTLPRTVTSAIVGLDATPDQVMRTLSITGGAQDGGSDGRKRVQRPAAARFSRTVSGWLRSISTDSDGTERPGQPQPIIRARSLTGAYAAPVARDFLADLPVTSGQGAELFLELRPDPGAPMTCLGLTATIQVSD